MVNPKDNLEMMSLCLGLLILIYQTDLVVSDCNVTNCDNNYCNGTSCTQCLPGYWFYEQVPACEKCYLYCRECSGSTCYSCFTEDCSSDICTYKNCKIAGCSRNTIANCISCPDGFYLTNRRCYRCNDINCKCTSAFNCNECLPGYYGTSNACISQCPGNCISCKSSAECDKCIVGKYGQTCDTDCITICQDGTCDKVSGTCLEPCALNEYFDSGVCKPCPNRCLSCDNWTYCTACERYYHWGPHCQYECTGCYSRCNRTDGCSAGYCDPKYYSTPYNSFKAGFECIRCLNQCKTCDNETHCTLCEDNFWGRQCRYSCSYCSGNCDKVFGCGMDCELGYYPERIDTGYECKRCSQKCEECNDSTTCTLCVAGYFVDDNWYCSICSSSCKGGKCERTNGTCTDGCVPGHTGQRCDEVCPEHCTECDRFDSSHCNSCETGFYGDSCKKTCSKNCKTQNEIHECHKNNGSCLYGCADGHWTETCIETCSEGCANNHLCNETNGVCLHGCFPNYQGELCLTQCSQTCLNVSESERLCDETSGDCLGACQDGWYGADCSLQCSDNCHQNKCFQHNGTCELICVDGSSDARCSEEKTTTTTHTTDKHKEAQPGTGGEDDGGGSVAGPAGAGIGAAVVIVIVVVIVVLLLRRRRQGLPLQEAGKVSANTTQGGQMDTNTYQDLSSSGPDERTYSSLTHEYENFF